jgi:hypothetical protein
VSSICVSFRAPTEIAKAIKKVAPTNVVAIFESNLAFNESIASLFGLRVGLNSKIPGS